MAEMTVEKAVEWLTSDKAFGQEFYSRKQIAALLESQAAEIERLSKRLEAAEKVCRAAEELSILYDGDLDTNKPQLYETWTAVDDALAKWNEAQ